MNPNNYASLEASKRLVEAGIVLETEAVWIEEEDIPFGESTKITTTWRLHNKKEVIVYNFGMLPSGVIILPAPCMAEVWRELPELIDEYDLTCEKIFNGGMQAGYTTYDVSGLRWKVLLNNTNPTDALIDLLIAVRKEASHET